MKFGILKCYSRVKNIIFGPNKNWRNENCKNLIFLENVKFLNANISPMVHRDSIKIGIKFTNHANFRNQ
jgi:hypothetical protein